MKVITCIDNGVAPVRQQLGVSDWAQIDQERVDDSDKPALVDMISRVVL